MGKKKAAAIVPGPFRSEASQAHSELFGRGFRATPNPLSNEELERRLHETCKRADSLLRRLQAFVLHDGKYRPDCNPDSWEEKAYWKILTSVAKRLRLWLLNDLAIESTYAFNTLEELAAANAICSCAAEMEASAGKGIPLATVTRFERHVRVMRAYITKPEPPALPRVRVDVHSSRVWVDDVAFEVTPNQAEIIAALVEHDGEPIGLSVVGDGARRARDLDGLPSELSALIQTSNKGTWIPRELLWLA